MDGYEPVAVGELRVLHHSAGAERSPGVAFLAFVARLVLLPVVIRTVTPFADDTDPVAFLLELLAARGLVGIFLYKLK